MYENIHNVTSALISQIGSEELFQEVVDNARKVSDAKFVILSLYDEENETTQIKAISGAESSLLNRVSDVLGVGDLFEVEFPVGRNTRFKKFSEKKEKKTLVLDGFKEYAFDLFDERVYERVEGLTEVEEIIVTPLLNGEEKLIGILGYLFTKERKDRDHKPLMIFADLASQAIEKSRMFNELKKRQAEEIRRENVNMTAEVMTSDIIRKFEEKVSLPETGLKRSLEHMAELAVEPSPPSVIFDFMISIVQKSLSEEGVEADSAEVRSVLSPHLKRFLMEIFSLANDLGRDIPVEYEEFEEHLVVR